MNTLRRAVAWGALVGLLLPAALPARDSLVQRLQRRPPQRFLNYRQVALTLQRAEFANAFGTLDRNVAAALGQPDLLVGEVLPAAAAMADAVNAESTGTNTQVEGVDEADLVKTDGTHLYLITQNRLAVVRGATAAGQSLELVSLLPFGDDGFVPSELHLYGHFLVVIGMSYNYDFLADPAPASDTGTASATALWCYPRTPTASTVIRVYDVTNPAAVSLVRTLDVEGSHLTSRRLGQYLYVLTRSYPSLAAVDSTTSRVPGTGLVPRVRDSLSRKGLRPLLPPEISALPGCYEASYLVVAALDLGRATGAFTAQAFLGAGNVVYASQNNLYVAVSSWLWRPMLLMDADRSLVGDPAAETVTLYRFALGGTRVQYAARGEVPGRVLNSFCMDERQGVFRIATTTYPTVWTEAAQSSGVYTLNLDLQRLGALDGLAPGERIYAARFLEDRCYLVTFKTIDPLFVIDLADPAALRLLGELKIPGYSSYLHPFDATHLIGLGKDVSLVRTPWSGDEGVALEQGLKVSLFDVSDVARPVELQAEHIGARGSDSEALRDHHAFLYNAARGLLAFPCTVREFVDPPEPADPWWWGDFVFQGVLAYNVSLARGFQRLGAVTHVAEDTVDAWDAPWDRCVRRAVLLGEALHTVSAGMIKAHDAATLAELSVLELPVVETLVNDPVVSWLLADGAAAEGSAGLDLTAGVDAMDPEGNAEPAVSAAAALGNLLRRFITARR